MNVLQFTSSYPPNVYGGDASQVAFIHERIRRDGHICVTVFYGVTPDACVVRAPDVWAVADGPRDLRIEHDDRRLLAVNLRAIREAHRRCTCRPCVIHLHTPLFTQSAVCLSRQWDVPLMYTCHFPGSMYMDNGGASGNKAIEAGEKIAFQSATGIISVSDWLTNRAKSAPAAAQCPLLRTIRNGVDTEFFAPEPELKRSFVLFLGRLSQQKGVEALPGIVEKIQSQRPIPLVICGRGHSEAALRQALKSFDVRYRGFQTATEVARLLREAVALLMPSVWDPCPVAALEAAASATPVVATRVPGLDEIVRHGETGFLVDRRGLWGEEMARRVIQLWDDASARRWMGDNGRRLAISQFSADAMVNQVIKAYENVVALHASRRRRWERV